MKDIFISYRRKESSGHAGRLYADLSSYFGKGSIFMDIDDIRGGDDFVKTIKEQIDSSRAMLVVIDRNWLTVSNEKGRRLDDPQDHVRFEIMTALSKNLLVVPVLVQGVIMPTEEALPPELKSLVFLNAVRVSDERWDSDINRLAKTLELDVPGSIAERKFDNLKRLILALIFTAVCLSVIQAYHSQKDLLQAALHYEGRTFDEGWVLRFLYWSKNIIWSANIIVMLGATILLPVAAMSVENTAKKFMWMSLVFAGLSVFFMAINQPLFTILINTAILVLLNMSTFKPR